MFLNIPVGFDRISIHSTDFVILIISEELQFLVSVTFTVKTNKSEEEVKIEIQGTVSLYSYFMMSVLRPLALIHWPFRLTCFSITNMQGYRYNIGMPKL